MTPVHEFDPLTRWLIDVFLLPYHRLIGHRFKTSPNVDAKIFVYNDAHLEAPAHIISTILASLLPVIAIVVLYVINDMAKRLGLIAVFTTVFSACLAALTRANRFDTFAATAAYVKNILIRDRELTACRFAAVQVVFIGTNNPIQPSQAG